MGFLDKAKQLAQKAQELQKEGLQKAQQMRAAQSPGATSAAPPASPAAGQQITNQGPEVMASTAGLPNPATLLSSESIAGYTGQAPNEPRLECGDGCVTAIWESDSGWSIAVNLFCPTNAEGRGPVSKEFASQRFARVRDNYTETVDIPGAEEARGDFGEDPGTIFWCGDVAGGVGGDQLSVGDVKGLFIGLTSEVVSNLPA